MLIKRGERAKDTYDVIVIGSGLSGMTAANVAAKNGRKVLLLEAHNKLGGLATWFFREEKRYIFDVSLHGFPFGMKKTMQRYWSKNIADQIIQLKDVRFINPQFEISTDYTKEHFTNILVNKFFVPSEKVDAFFNYIEKMNFYDKEQMTVGELFETFFPGRNDVTRLLMEPITYANGSTLSDPALTYAIVFSNFMGKGVYTFKGGTDQLIKQMRDELLSNHVDIMMNAKASDVLVENDHKMVTVNNQKIKSSAVISNANLHHTIFGLLKNYSFDPSFLEKAKAVRMNSSSCQVYMALKENESIPFIGDLIFTSTHPTYNADALLSSNITSRTFSIYYPELRPGDGEGSGKYYIVSSTNAHYEDWKKLSPDEYKMAKEKMISETIEALENILPDIKKKIAFIDAATPITVESFTHHYRGASFGTKFEGLEVSMNLHKEVPGFFHSGSVGIIMSGWLGAANYGVIQANNLESYLNSIHLQNSKPNNKSSEHESTI